MKWRNRLSGGTHAAGERSASGTGIGILVGDQAEAVIRNGLVRGMGNVGISVVGAITNYGDDYCSPC